MKTSVKISAAVIFCIALMGCNNFKDDEKNLFQSAVVEKFRSPDHSDANADEEITLFSTGKSGEYESKIVRIKWKNENQLMGVRTLCSYIHYSNDAKFGKWANIVVSNPYGVDGKDNSNCISGKVFSADLAPNSLPTFNDYMKKIGYTGTLPQ
jgi:uncharacterized lipoprotein NlpE involved in copper resistance